MKGRVLLTEGLAGQSRCTTSAVRALAVEGYAPTVTVSGTLSLAAASRYCARRVRVPLASDPEYAQAVKQEAARLPYVAVLPTSDAALLALGAPVRHLMDKAECARRAAEAGIPVAPMRVFDSRAGVLQAACEFRYPVVVKPTIKVFNARRVDRREDLRHALIAESPIIVQPWLEAAHHCVVGLVWKGDLIESAHIRYERLWPLPCGTVTAATTIRPDRGLEERLLQLLAGYDGVFHAEFVGPYLQDLNPRIHGSLPLAVASGVNLVSRYCDLAAGGDAVRHRRGRAGVRYRWLEGDVRSIVKSWAIGSLPTLDAAEALLPRRGTVHSYVSLDDPGPVFERIRFVARRLRASGAERGRYLEVRE